MEMEIRTLHILFGLNGHAGSDKVNAPLLSYLMFFAALVAAF
jgi:hypothetical protein